MKKSTITAIVIALILIVAGVAIIASAGEFSLSELSTEKYENTTFPITEEFFDIDINDEEYDINVIRSSDDTCYAETLDSDKIYHTVTVEDGTLKITRTDTRKWYEHIGIYWNERLSVDLYLPMETYGNVYLKSVSGDVTVAEGFTFGETELKSTSGDISFASSCYELSAKSVSGDISVSAEVLGKADLSSTSGDLKIDLSAADLTAKSVSGGVDIGGSVKNSVGVSTTSGDLMIEDLRPASLTAGSSSGRISVSNVNVNGPMELRTVSGEIRFLFSDAESLFVKTTSGAVWGSLLSGKIFRTDTTSGSVRVPYSSSDGGICEIVTTSGDINISIVE